MGQQKNDLGQFTSKSEDERKVRSIRATDATWMRFGDAAEERGITRADLLELMVEDNRFDQLVEEENQGVDIKAVLDILEEAISYKGNAGNQIKDKVREAIALIKYV